MSEMQFEIQRLIESELDRYDLLEDTGMLVGASYRTKPEHLSIAINEWLADRLAVRDRENRAIGWDEANEVTEDYWREGGIGRPYPTNPYRGDQEPRSKQTTPTCATCGKPSTYRLGMLTPSWCDEHGPHRGDNR